MKLNDFEKHIDETILDRGYDYYDEGRINEVIKQGDRDYLFTVAGTEVYQVFVKFDDQGEITQTGCNCPYDFGPICKHQVAAFYVLTDIIENRQSEGLKIERAIQQRFLTEVLDNLTKEQLITIIIEMAEKDEILKNGLMMRYSKGNPRQELQKCKRLMESIVSKYQGRSGYIEYREADEFADEMDELLEVANDTEDRCLAMDIASMLLIEAVEAFQYADDSDGSIGQLVSAAIDTIENIVTNNMDLEIGLKTELFEKLVKLSDESVFDGWEDFRIDLLQIGIETLIFVKEINRLMENTATVTKERLPKVYSKELVNLIFKEKFEMDKTNPENAIKELMMVLMYLTRFNESDRFGSKLDISWKGYDFDVIDELDEEDYIRQGNHRSKSVAITEAGIKLSQSLLNKYNILDWE